MRPWVCVSAITTIVLAACGDSSSPATRIPDKRGGAGSSGAGGNGEGGAAGWTGSGGTTTGGIGTGGISGRGGSGGNGGPAGSGGSAGNGGQPIDAGRPDVTFDWPESMPGAKCLAGRYQGTFAGIYASPATVFPAPIPVAGDINLTLVQSTRGEFLEIVNGKLSGTADLIFPFSADLVGSLNCKAAKLDPMTALRNGTYDVFGLKFTFEGPFLGDYDKANVSFVNGTWDVKEPIAIYGGAGTWTAKWVGP